jgi:hypothetical protein
MGLARPTAEYAEQMLDPGGWPEVDENALYDRAEEYAQVLREVNGVFANCRRAQLNTFDGGDWSGGAANAANNTLGTDLDALRQLQEGLAGVITWHKFVAYAVVQAKSDISDNVCIALEKVHTLQHDSRLTAEARTAAIDLVTSTTHAANAGLVTATAEAISVSAPWKAPTAALPALLDLQPPPPIVSLPLAPVISMPFLGAGPTPMEPNLPELGTEPAPLNPSNPSAPEGPTTAPHTPTPLRPGVPVKPGSGSTRGKHAAGKGASPAAAVGKSRPSADDSPDSSSPPACMGAAGAMPMALGASGGGAVPGGLMGNQSGTGPAIHAASAGETSVRRDSGLHRLPEPARLSVSVAAAESIPVSPARMERDAIIESANVDAARRNGAERLQLARRIAAALAAPVGDQEPDFGFAWVTGLMTDGTIVVANSYGLAYIPEGVKLPDEVQMATADESIPAIERARWATYPVLAVQGWATHHGFELRAVIATAEQFADSDPGVAKIVLQADDIPDSGEMVGRARLEVVDPDAAQRLTETPDAGLISLLSPGPSADKPQSQESKLWLRVVKPLASSAANRHTGHLRAFHIYADHARGVMAAKARSAVDPEAQRCAVADWLYWTHLAGILDGAFPAAA